MTPLDAWWLKFWETVSAAGFFLVFLGVIGESVDLYEKTRIRLGRPRFSKQSKRRLFWVEVCAFWILVLGLAGEFIGESRARRIADKENARLNEEAKRSEKEAAQLKLDLAKIDPLNVPIKSVRANVYLKASGRVNMQSMNGWKLDKKFGVGLIVLDKNGKVIVGLHCTDITASPDLLDASAQGENVFERFEITFSWPSFSPFEKDYFLAKNDISTRQLDKDMASIFIHFDYMTRDSNITFSTFTLIINGSIPRNIGFTSVDNIGRIWGTPLPP